MSLVCSAIVGFLCIQAPIPGVTTIKLEDQGIWVANAIEAKNWKASWGRSMEWPAPRIDPSRLAKACVGETCVSYWRKCSSDFACTYFFDDGHGFALTAKIEAKDQKGLDEAMQSVGIVTKWQQPVIAVPLTATNVEGKGDKPPVN
jgi:hypothetical protein